jgi:PEP-CTERM motif-containing protein
MTMSLGIRPVPMASRFGRYVAPALFALGFSVSLQQATAAGFSSSDFVLGIVNTSGLCEGSQSVTGVTTISSTASVSAPVNCSGPTWSETAAAGAEFGSLKALGDLRFKNFVFGPNDNEFHFLTRAEAGFTDKLTFSKGSFWEFTVAVDGQSVFINSNGVSTVTNNGWWCFNMFGAGCGISPYGVTSLGSQTFRFPISSNGTVMVNADLRIDVGTDLFRDRLPNNFLLTSDVFVDLSHTVRFLSSRVLDANGQPIGDATITSDSGFDYLAVSGVPEPASFVSLTLGLAGLVLFRRWRKTAARP